MIVVTNAGPLMALAKLGILHLLDQLYGKVLMPVALYDEVVLRGMEQGFSDSLQVKLAIQQKHLVVKAVKKQSADIIALPLHEGEKETLSLSIKHKADLVLLDDRLEQRDVVNLLTYRRLSKKCRSLTNAPLLDQKSFLCQPPQQLPSFYIRLGVASSP